MKLISKQTGIRVTRYEFEHDVFGKIQVDDYWDNKGHMGIEIYDKYGVNFDDYEKEHFKDVANMSSGVINFLNELDVR